MKRHSTLGRHLLQTVTKALSRRHTSDMIRGMLMAAAVTGFATLPGAAMAEQTGALHNAVGTIYTADEYGNSISEIDLASKQIRTVPVEMSPHNVQITPDGLWLLAVGSATMKEAPAQGAMSHDAMEVGRLLVFNARQIAAGPVASIDVGKHPAHVVTDLEGRRAFITLAGENAVAVVDLSSSKVVAEIPTGRYPHGLRISPDGKFAYVADVKEGSVSIIDTEALTEVARIPVGKAPVQVGFTPDGSRAFVSLRDENRVAVIDTAKRVVTDRIAVGRNPIQVHVTPDGRSVYVANQGTETEPADTVSVIDVMSGTVQDTIRTAEGAHGVAVNADGRYVFVTNIVDGTVSMIATNDRSVVETFRVGEGPNGITFRPGGV